MDFFGPRLVFGIAWLHDGGGSVQPTADAFGIRLL